MKRRISSIALALLLSVSVVALSACGGTQNTGGTQSATTTESSVKTEASAVKTMKGDALQKIQDDAKEKDKVLLIDVRKVEEYAAGHIKHAINVPLADVDAKIADLSRFKDKPVILYCNTGRQSGEAADKLIAAGFKDVTNAEGVKDFEYKNMTKYNNIIAEDLVKMTEDGKTVILDARPAEDYQKGTLKGSISIPPGELEKNIDKLPEDKAAPIATYCFTGNKSAELAQELTDKGYTNVSNSVEGTKEFEYKMEAPQQ